MARAGSPAVSKGVTAYPGDSPEADTAVGGGLSRGLCSRYCQPLVLLAIVTEQGQDFQKNKTKQKPKSPR